MKAVLIEEGHKHILQRFCLTLPQFQKAYRELTLQPPTDHWQTGIIERPHKPAIRLNYCLAYVGDDSWITFFKDLSSQTVPVMIDRERIFALLVETSPKYNPKYYYLYIPSLPVSPTRESIKQDLLITMGCRAGCMDCDKQISLPVGVMGEYTLSDFVSAMVYAYMTTELEAEFGFDDYIENLLMVKFPFSDTESTMDNNKHLHHKHVSKKHVFKKFISIWNRYRKSYRQKSKSPSCDS